MTVLHTNSLLITLRPDNKQLCIECLEDLNSEGFQSGLIMALALAKEHTIRYWMIDARKIGELSEQDESWIQINFFPQLMEPNNTCYIAMVISNNCYDRMLLESGWFGLKSYNSFIRINTFYNIQDANHWLNTHSTGSHGF